MTDLLQGPTAPTDAEAPTEVDWARLERELEARGTDRDPDFIRRAQPILERYASYFRPEVRGFERLPASGPFLVVGNHSGGATPPDLPILLTAWWRERGIEEPVHGLFHSFFLSLPGVGGAVRRAGALDASPDAARGVLDGGGVVVVYPGGDHEAYRPWTQRDRIDFNGRKGFIRLAMETGVPIVTATSCGAHDGTIVLARGERLARFMPHLRLARIKVMPLLLGPPWGLTVLPTLPLPSQVTVELSGPTAIEGDPGDDAAVDAAYERVTSAMQGTLSALAAERGR
jgi:1-acyl-sn-glycerol-3-phosphate acyltransferase